MPRFAGGMPEGACAARGQEGRSLRSVERQGGRDHQPAAAAVRQARRVPRQHERSQLHQEARPLVGPHQDLGRCSRRRAYSSLLCAVRGQGE